MTLIDKLNQATRASVTLALCAGFIYLALTGKVSGEVYTAVFSGIVGFWFGIRGAAGSSPPGAP